MAIKTRKEQRNMRHLRIRSKIMGTAARPRFCVSITASNIYLQFIDDENGVTLAMTSSLDKQFKEQNVPTNMDGAKVLGKMAAEKAVAANISNVVFDRSGYKFHGRIKAIADAARENGLNF
ncbi:MAG: 50S ribosomal protein L18 [Lentisphaerae bacterium]|jgi:large subunit ribosomal protein L18|nr:50S ribosomal protein L18 [Lentisphaerota bacterium]